MMPEPGWHMPGNLPVFVSALLMFAVTLVLKVDPLVAFGITAGLGAILILLIYVALAVGADCGEDA